MLPDTAQHSSSGLAEARPQPYRFDDEIDLFELFSQLWQGRVQIISAIIISALLGAGLFYLFPRNYEISFPLSPKSEFAFFDYAVLNQILAEHQLDYQLDAANIFASFVSEFNDYEEVVSVLAQNPSVYNQPQLGKAQNTDGYLFSLAKRFRIMPDENIPGQWRISLFWHEQETAISIISDALSEVLAKTYENKLAELDRIIESFEVHSKFEQDKIHSLLSALEKSIQEKTEQQLQFLTEQLDIAQVLDIQESQLDRHLSSYFIIGSQDADYPVIPFYYRVAKAIEQEIAILTGRTEQQSLLMEQRYIDLKGRLAELENDISLSQLTGARQKFAAVQPSELIIFNIYLADIETTRKLSLYLGLSVVLGGMLGVIYVLVANTIRARRSFSDGLSQ